MSSITSNSQETLTQAAVGTEQSLLPVTFTEAAALRVRDLLKEEGNYNLKLRVFIRGGGCSGFEYGFAFDENVKEGDAIFEKTVKEDDLVDNSEDNQMVINLIIDPVSLMYLTGAQIDYVENLQGAHFVVNNPNAQTTCSCGSSFSL